MVLFLYLYMINLHVTDEVSSVESCCFRNCNSMGQLQNLEDAYDPKSAEHIKAGTYPKEDRYGSEKWNWCFRVFK